jgi:hypothetical protein
MLVVLILKDNSSFRRDSFAGFPEAEEPGFIWRSEIFLASILNNLGKDTSEVERSF